MDLHTGMKLERELFGICYASEDKKEGAEAFIQKREPKFKIDRKETAVESIAKLEYGATLVPSCTGVSSSGVKRF